MATLSNLLDDTIIVATVTPAETDEGDRVEGDAVTGIIAAVPAGSITTSATDTQITFTWGGVCPTRRRDITGYVYSFGPAAGQDTTTTDVAANPLRATVGQLTPGTPYSFSVAARTSTGVGRYTTPVTVSTMASPVAFATNTVLEIISVTSDTAQVSWALPTGVNPDTTYAVRYRTTLGDQCQPTPNSPWTTLSPVPASQLQLPVTLTGLSPYTTYTIEVLGTVPDGPPGLRQTSISGEITTTSSAALVSPVGVTTSAVTMTSVRITWNTLNCGDRRGNINYLVMVQTEGGTTQVQTVPGTTAPTASTTILSLIPGTTYTLSVAAAASSTVIGPYSVQATITTLAPAEPLPCTACTPNRVIGFQVVIVRTSPTTPAVFIPQLNNPNSDEYMALVIEVTVSLQVYCDQIVGCIGVVIISFFPGSIGVMADFILRDSTITTGAMLMDVVLEVAAENNNDIGGNLFIDPARTQSNDLCPPGYCENGGTCISDTESMTGICTCVEGFGGTQCMDVVQIAPTAPPGMAVGDDSNDEAIAIAIIVISGGLVLITAVIALAVIVFVRIIQPRMAMRRLYFNNARRPHPTALVAQDPLLVDAVTLQSPWTFRNTMYDGNMYYLTRE